MNVEPDLERLARTLGDPTRMGMLVLLMEGRALTAKELAYGSGVQPSTATEHLKRLQADGLIESSAQGRHKYYRLAAPDLARAIELLMAVAKPRVPVLTPRNRPTGELGLARFCYDHLAGHLGTGIAKALFERELLHSNDEEVTVTSQGEAWFAAFGIDLDSLRRCRRRFAYSCLDWSEREDHLGGALGAAMAARMIELGWVQRRKHTRIVDITAQGHEAIEETFGFALDPHSGSRQE